MRSLGEIQAGQTVGRYEFLLPIAQGGMAAVWAARLKGSRGFSKNVAVKTMLPTISDDPQFEQMFLDEARIASRIRHPNAVEILDLGEQDDLLYLVMEWVDGEPLSAIRRAAAKAGGFPRPIAVKIIADACAGLHAAHQLKDEEGRAVGLVHRDVSPQNILITYDGVVKIVDFGVAKAAGRSAENTNSGQVKGKPPYMSPEQALGNDVDRRTDLFALGIILYQLTTGKHPFRGESDIVTLQNIVSDRPIIPPRAYDKEFPKPLEAVVLKALDRDPDKRFQTAAELEAALDRVFPPTVPRVRTEDVGRFVKSLVGERGDERRVALREAIKNADERAPSEELPSSLRPMGELGTTVGRGVLASNPTPLGANSLAPPTLDGMRGSHPSSAEGLTDSARLSLPGTPFGTQSPTAPPATRKSSSAIWVVLGLLVLMGGAGAVALVASGVLSRDTASAESETKAKVAAPAAPNENAPEKPAVAAPADKPDESGAIDPSELALEKKPASGAAPAAAPVKKPDPKKADPKAEKPDKTEKPVEKKPIKKPAGGFVPPPITDPGF